MKALLIDVNRREIAEVDIFNRPDIYKLINCRTIDVIRRYIGSDKRLYDIILDDEGKLKPNQIVSGISSDFSELLVGNLLIARSNKFGNRIGLTDADIYYIKKSIITGHKVENEEVLSYPVLIDFDCKPFTLSSIFDEVYK